MKWRSMKGAKFLNLVYVRVMTGEKTKEDGINKIYYDKHKFLTMITIRITYSIKLMMGCQKSHPLSQAHNIYSTKVQSEKAIMQAAPETQLLERRRPLLRVKGTVPECRMIIFLLKINYDKTFQ
jgi:hypothetical protein